MYPWQLATGPQYIVSEGFFFAEISFKPTSWILLSKQKYKYTDETLKNGIMSANIVYCI